MFLHHILSLIYIHSRKIGILFSLLLRSLWRMQIVEYALACRSYSFVCILHDLIIIIVQTYLILNLNKANLRDLIAVTGLVILLKLDLNRRFFSPCDLEIWWMTPKNNRAPLLCYFKLFASFRSHWWIQTGVTARKSLIWVNIDAFFSHVTLKFDGWPSKTIGHLFYATSSFVQHFLAIGEFILELESGNAQSGSNSTLFRAVWPWNLTDDLEKQ